MDIIQTLKRIGQQSKGWAKPFNTQNSQMPIIKKLYLRNGLDLQMTCGACPEQYEVFKDGKQVAYYRLRHGEFRVDLGECGGETIYEAEPNGDGIFDADERFIYLIKAMREVLLKINLHF